MDPAVEASANNNGPKRVEIGPTLRENFILRENEMVGAHDVLSSSPPTSPGFPPTRSHTANSSRFSYAESAHIKSLKEGHYETFSSLNSTGSSDPRWVCRQNILCLDGGGIRGYSTLLILDQLMTEIEKIEKSHREPAQSSFHPHIPQSLESATLNGEPVKTNKRRTTLRSKGPRLSLVESPKPGESFYPW